MTLKPLTARIEQLEAARSRIDAGDPAPPAPIPQVTDWEARLSAARAVDVLTGANTAQAIEQARADEQRSIEQQAQEAARFAQEQAQRREAIDRLDRDLDAAQSLLERELRARSKTLAVEALTRYHAALVGVLEALARLAGALEASGEVAAANMALMTVTLPAIGDPALPAGFAAQAGKVTALNRQAILARAAAEVRELLITADEEEPADA